MSESVKINSDFIDYYDMAAGNTGLTYNRMRSESMSRAQALDRLKRLCIKTIEIKPVTKFIKQEYPIVVYTDPKLHDGKGKRLVDFEEANMYYSNCIASRFIETDNNIVIKYIQIGNRRFTIQYSIDEPLKLGSVIDIKECESSENKMLNYPIYSIDYIVNNGILIATDFNEVENFNAVGLSDIIPADEVIDQIYLYLGGKERCK